MKIIYIKKKLESIAVYVSFQIMSDNQIIRGEKRLLMEKKEHKKVAAV